MVTRVNRAPLLLGVCIATSIMLGCSSSAPLCQSEWQDKHVEVDGKTTEWTVPLRLYDNASKLNYVISNDDSNLYYCIRITDDKEQMRAMLAGMQIWIDTTGKTQQQVGIQFPFPQITGAVSGGKKPVHADSIQGGSGKLDEMRLTGFKYPISGVTPTLNKYGIKVKIARDSSHVTTYEGCIPFRTFYKPQLTAADNSKPLGVTIIINPMLTSSHKAKHGHGGDRGGFDGPGGMSLGMGGGFGGGRVRFDNDGEDESATSLIALKMQVKLSAK